MTVITDLSVKTEIPWRSCTVIYELRHREHHSLRYPSAIFSRFIGRAVQLASSGIRPSEISKTEGPSADSADHRRTHFYFSP